MPNPGELIGGLFELIGQIIDSSSLRLGMGPTLAVLGVLLVLLHLVARPTSRWTTRDLGGLAGVARSMALAAEAGSAAALSLGTAGLIRSTAAARRLQTLAAMPLLDHVARAAARSGVPLRLGVNDPVAALIARSVVDRAHEHTATRERLGRSSVEYIGEGRGVAAARALAERRDAAATFALGSLGEEGLVLIEGLKQGSVSATVGTADADQATSVLLEADGALVGPELFLAAGDLRAGSGDRNVSLASNRLLLIALGVLLIGSALALAGMGDLRGWLVGAG